MFVDVPITYHTSPYRLLPSGYNPSTSLWQNHSQVQLGWNALENECTLHTSGFLSLYFLGKFHININGNFAHKFSQAKIVHKVLIELRKSWVVVVVVVFPPWRDSPGAERPVPSARVCMYRRPNSSYRFSDALSSDASWGSHGRKIAGKEKKRRKKKWVNIIQISNWIVLLCF